MEEVGKIFSKDGNVSNKEDGVCLHVRYARPHLCMGYSLISLSDACAAKVTPKLGKNYNIQSD
jgi:hypothetical protein